MRAITVFRAIAVIGVMITWWSLNLQWGADIDAGSGPPNQFNRHAVGAGLLATICAIALWASGRKGQPPSWVARGVAIGAAAGSLLVVYMVRSKAHSSGFPHLIDGPGWKWMLAGSGIMVSAAAGALALRPPPPKGKAAKQKQFKKAKRKKKR
jgi:hypothetical protein